MIKMIYEHSRNIIDYMPAIIKVNNIEENKLPESK